MARTSGEGLPKFAKSAPGAYNLGLTNTAAHVPTLQTLTLITAFTSKGSDSGDSDNLWPPSQ
jgi:hypothetical protein